MGHLEAVQTLADLANEGAVLVEFEEPRTFAASRVDKNVALGVCGHADAFAQVQSRRKLQKIWYRIVRDVLRSGESLGRWRGALLRQAHRCKKEKKQARYECTPHLEPLSIRSVFPLDIRP